MSTRLGVMYFAVVVSTRDYHMLANIAARYTACVVQHSRLESFVAASAQIQLPIYYTSSP